MIRTNARGEVIVPFFRVGEPEFDLADLLASLDKVRSANQ